MKSLLFIFVRLNEYMFNNILHLYLYSVHLFLILLYMFSLYKYFQNCFMCVCVCRIIFRLFKSLNKLWSFKSIPAKKEAIGSWPGEAGRKQANVSQSSQNIAPPYDLTPILIGTCVCVCEIPLPVLQASLGWWNNIHLDFLPTSCMVPKSILNFRCWLRMAQKGCVAIRAMNSQFSFPFPHGIWMVAAKRFEATPRNKHASTSFPSSFVATNPPALVASKIKLIVIFAAMTIGC